MIWYGVCIYFNRLNWLMFGVECYLIRYDIYIWSSCVLFSFILRVKTYELSYRWTNSRLNHTREHSYWRWPREWPWMLHCPPCLFILIDYLSKGNFSCESGWKFSFLVKVDESLVLSANKLEDRYPMVLFSSTLEAQYVVSMLRNDQNVRSTIVLGILNSK